MYYLSSKTCKTDVAETPSHKMNKICRTCLREVSLENTVALSGKTEGSQVKMELSVCIPEMVIDLVVNPVLCSSCVSALHAAYTFKNVCLRTEEYIRSYMRDMHSNTKLLVLADMYRISEKAGLRQVVQLNNTTNVESSTRKLAEDLSSLLDEVLEDQLGVLNKQSESGDMVKEDATLSLKNKVVKRRLSSNNEFEDFHEESEIEQVDRPNEGIEFDEHCDLRVLQSRLTPRNCFVKLAKLPDELVYSKIKSTVPKSLTKCQFKTACGSYLKEHQNLHGTKTPLTCHICDYHTIYKRSLKKHLKDVHPEALLFKCDVCNYSTARKDHFKAHVLTHNVAREKPFSCDVCAFKSAAEYCLRLHMRRRHGEKLFKCKVCEKRFTDKRTLSCHIMVHSGEKPFVCNVCQFRTAYIGNLKKHMVTHTEETMFSCNVCGFGTLHKPYLVKHMRIHTGEKPFVCSLCSFCTASKERLQEHERTHSGERPFACKLCKLKFTHRTNLRRHMKTHSEEKLVCSKCDYICQRKFEMKAHINSHNANKVFSCSSCKYITSHKSCLAVHAKTHL